MILNLNLILSIGLPQFVTILDKMKARLKSAKQHEDLLFLQQLLNSKRFKSVIKVRLKELRTDQGIVSKVINF